MTRSGVDEVESSRLRQSAASLAEALPGRRPDLAGIRRSYLRLHDASGAPKVLPDVGSESLYQTAPEDCVGAKRPGVSSERGGIPCHDAVRCVFCNEKQARRNATKVAQMHVGQPNIHRVSIPVPGVQDPATGRDALSRVARSLRRTAGFSRVSLWLHVFGADPRDGARPHIEGVISGTDANPDVLDPSVPSGLSWTLRGFMPHDGDGVWPVEVFSHDDFHPHSRHHVHDLLRVGVEVGRAGIDARRIHAGLYRSGSGELRVRYTDVHARCRPTHIRDVGGPNPCDDWREEELMGVLRTAAEWRGHGRRPVLSRSFTVSDRHLELVMDNAPWADYYRIPNAEVMRRRCGPAAIDRQGQRAINRTKVSGL